MPGYGQAAATPSPAVPASPFADANPNVTAPAAQAPASPASAGPAQPADGIPAQPTPAPAQAPYATQAGVPNTDPYAQQQPPVYAAPGTQPAYAQDPYMEDPYAQQYNPQQYGAQQYPYAPAQAVQATDGVSIAALVTSLLGFLGAIAVVPVFGSIAGLILGIIGVNRTKINGKKGRGMAIAGIVLGALGVVLSIGAIVLWSWLIAQEPGTWEHITHYPAPGSF
jgi:hypothetical protein